MRDHNTKCWSVAPGFLTVDFCSTRFIARVIEKVRLLLLAGRRDRLVVRTLRCGRSNPGSNPGHGSFLPSNTFFTTGFFALQNFFYHWFFALQNFFFYHKFFCPSKLFFTTGFLPFKTFFTTGFLPFNTFFLPLVFFFAWYARLTPYIFYLFALDFSPILSFFLSFSSWKASFSLLLKLTLSWYRWIQTVQLDLRLLSDKYTEKLKFLLCLWKFTFRVSWYMEAFWWKFEVSRVIGNGVMASHIHPQLHWSRYWPSGLCSWCGWQKEKAGRTPNNNSI